jgi:hypothetical protein
VLRRALGLAVVCLGAVTPLAGQTSAITIERGAFATWLATAPVSPLAAIAQQPIGQGLRLGPADADVPLDGLPEQRVGERAGTVTLETAGGRRVLPRGLPVTIGVFTLVADGPTGRAVLTVFGPRHSGRRPTYYPPEAPLVFVGPLSPPDAIRTVRLLGLDGVEVEAVEAGSVVVPIEGARTRLLVRRLPVSGGEESELEIFFRDATSGNGTYPAGRFVTLVPESPGRYRLDFNRARNPFCAYSSVYACPAPWRGNTIGAPITAGERYDHPSADSSTRPRDAG